jgi:hypothetical protein
MVRRNGTGARGSRKWVPAVIAAATACLLVAACRNEGIVIQVKKPPDIDPSVYRRVAVLPFSGDEDEGL